MTRTTAAVIAFLWIALPLAWLWQAAPILAGGLLLTAILFGTAVVVQVGRDIRQQQQRWREINAQIRARTVDDEIEDVAIEHWEGWA